MSWSVIIERWDGAGNPLKDVRANFKNHEDALLAFSEMRETFRDDENKVVTMVHDEQAPLNFELDPALEAQEAQRKHNAEEERIQALCDSLEGHGMCGQLTPIGDEMDRNWAQCHVCDEWGIVTCDFGTHGDRPLCEKHLMAASDDRLQTFLNLYGVNRVFGGPEEGGWYFNVGEPLLSVPICDNYSDDAIEEMRGRMRELGPQFLNRLNDGWEDRYEGYNVAVEFRHGRYWPLERPHYE